MRVLLIAVGNRLRHDDGVAHEVLDLVTPAEGLELLHALQLTIDYAPVIASYQIVVFVDADADALEVSIKSVNEMLFCPMITHVGSPSEIVALSRELFGFAGSAYVCCVPIQDLRYGEGLSLSARAYAMQAAAALESWLPCAH